MTASVKEAVVPLPPTSSGISLLRPSSYTYRGKQGAGGSGVSAALGPAAASADCRLQSLVHSDEKQGAVRGVTSMNSRIS